MDNLSDEQLIQERKKMDIRRFMVDGLNPEIAPRLSPALVALREMLQDGQWHSWNSAIACMLRASDLAVKTADGQIRNAITAEFIDRQGEYMRATRSRGKSVPAIDKREVRLVEWPDVWKG